MRLSKILWEPENFFHHCIININRLININIDNITEFVHCWTLNNNKQFLTVSDEDLEDSIRRFSYHVFATRSVWVASVTLGCVGCDRHPRAIVNVIWAQIQRARDDSILVLTEVKEVPRLREDETGHRHKQHQDSSGTSTNNHNTRNRRTVNKTKENHCTRRKHSVDAWPALRGAWGSRSRRRPVAPGTSGQVCPSASLTVAAGRWLWSGHTATEGIKMNDTAYQLACVTNIP